MELAWYRGVPLYARPDEPPYLTTENITVGGVYSADGPDGIGDQYFQGLAFLGQTRATWIVAPRFPPEIEKFLSLPVVSVRILRSEDVWATVQVEAITPVGDWMRQATLRDTDDIRSIPPDFLTEEPLRNAIRSWPISEVRVWLNAKGPHHPLRSPNALQAVLSMSSAEGRRLLVVTSLAEVCFLVHDH